MRGFQGIFSPGGKAVRGAERADNEGVWARGSKERGGRAGRLQYAPAGGCGQAQSSGPRWDQSPWQGDEVIPESAIEEAGWQHGWELGV